MTFVSLDCSECIDDLDKWKEWIDQYRNKVNFVLYYNTSDEVRKRYVCEEYSELSNYMVFDENNRFLKDNGMRNLSRIFCTLLLDKSNNVLLVGNPFSGDELGALYRNLLEK
ncbi:MAG: hypothetical protein JEZ14_14195 [Marinilabiliaceae bacterium]|nr:hypothetical protein [Marinilabiliaceae bacterium]